MSINFWTIIFDNAKRKKPVLRKQMETLYKQLSVAPQIFPIILMFQLFSLQQYFQRQGIMPLFSKTHPAKQNETTQPTECYYSS